MKQHLWQFQAFILFGVFLFCWGEFSFAQAPQSRPLQVDERKQLEALAQRFTGEFAEYISGNVWTLTHVSRSKKETEECLNLLQAPFDSLAKNDASLLNQIGGVKGFKDKFAKLLQSKDDTVQGFAAAVLAICGDVNYVPQIAQLLIVTPSKTKRDDTETTARGSAATALGILGAKKYVKRIARLLTSKNSYDQSGAATALGYLDAKEYARQIASLLHRDGYQYQNDESPIYALFKMGMAKDYKKEFATILPTIRSSEMIATAAYALASLRANEYAENIARLLAEDHKRGEAAKALAIMGETKFSDRIASLLNSKNSLEQQAASLALGVLGAKEYVRDIAKLLKAEEDFVRYYAAVALVLLEADEYAKEIVSLIEKYHREGSHLHQGDFHPLVKTEYLEIEKRFRQGVERLKSLPQ